MRLAIVTGGNVAEREISLLSANTVAKNIDPEKFETNILDYNEGEFVDLDSKTKVNLNDFSLAGKKFDAVFLMLHGHPAEDGHLQGYFKMLGIPTTGCDTFTSALTFSKQGCKDFLHRHDIPMANSVVVTKNDNGSLEKVKELSLPLFVKPNKNGSSFGVTKAVKESEVLEGIEKAFQFDDEVIVEEFLEGKEVSNGVFRQGKNIIVMPITEIVPKTEFFDYQAKYENLSEEITPARLTQDEETRCKQLTEKLYVLLNCKGICRIDYILVDGTFCLLEVNTIPGMSPNSLIPQQARAMNLKLSELYEAVIEEALA